MSSQYSAASSPPVPTRTESIRRDFARAWGQIGAAWGVAPSTAAVQGYLLVHGGPLTEAEVRSALDLSPRATRLALADCEAWGIIERATERRRSGQRGPAGVAWVPIADDWEWFRRVAAARKARETDPVLPVLRACVDAAELAASEEPEAAAVRARVASLLEFVTAFDRSVGGAVRADPVALRKIVGTGARLEPDVLDRLLASLAALPEEDVARAADAISRLPPRTLARLVRVIGRPGIGRLLGR